MKIADSPPTHCSCCYGTNIESPHVDFEVTYEGPVFLEKLDADPVLIDEIIMCESCMEEAAGLLGFVKAEETLAKMDDMAVELARLEGALVESRTYASSLESALQSKPEPPVPVVAERPVVTATVPPPPSAVVEPPAAPKPNCRYYSQLKKQTEGH